MAKNEIIYRTQSANIETTTVSVVTETPVTATIFTAGSNGSKIYTLYTQNVGLSSSYTISIEYYNSAASTTHALITSNFAANTDIIAALNAVAILPRDPNGNKYLNLNNGDLIKVICTNGVNSSANTVFTVYAEDY